MSIINAGNMREGVAGFTAYIEANGGGKYEIVANEDDNGDARRRREVTAALLAAHPDIAGIAGFDSEFGAGIVRALQEAGKKPGDIKVTAMEQTPDFFKTAKEGWVDGIIVQNRELFIYYAVKMLHDYNHNGLKTVRPGRRRRRRADPGQRRHRRAPGHQGQRRQGADARSASTRSRPGGGRPARPPAAARPSSQETAMAAPHAPASASSASPPTRS